MKKVGILGYGEIGKAVSRFYKKTFVKDLKRNDGLYELDVLHVCIPYTKDFIRIVKKQQKESHPLLTIIHSTVPLGTTRKIGHGTVHSPVKGVHPYLYKGIKIFLKDIGANSKEDAREAEKHFKSLGIKTKTFSSSEETEARKLWETTQSAWIIILQKLIKKWCDKKGLNFNVVYTEANKEFKRGYSILGYEEECLPIYRDMPGKIGGHCLIPNCRLLDSWVAKTILKQNEHL